jgi:hypothetical protein
MKTSEGAGGAAVSFDPNRHYQGLSLQDSALHWQEKKFIFPKQRPPRALLVHPVAGFERITAYRIYSGCEVSLWNCDRDASRRSAPRLSRSPAAFRPC